MAQSLEKQLQRPLYGMTCLDIVHIRSTHPQSTDM